MSMLQLRSKETLDHALRLRRSSAPVVRSGRGIMGELINGQWHRSGLDAILFNEVLRRPSSIFRDWLTARRCKTSIAAATLAAIAAFAFAQVVWQRPNRHETITFYDASRDNRPVAVEIAVRRDKEIQANAGLIKLPVAVLNHGNKVKFTQYSFLANVFAARGFIAISIPPELPTDPPVENKVGEFSVD